MSAISGVNGASDQWAQMRSQLQAKMFAKADSDGSGGVDKTELNSLFNDIAQKTGSTASSTDTDKLFAKMDGNGDGTLSSDELASGMQSLMPPPPPPPSTMDFAQSRSSTDTASTGTTSTDTGDDLFSKIDSDADGKISKSELQAFVDKINGTSTSDSTSSTASATSSTSSSTSAYDASTQANTSTASATQKYQGFDASKLARLLYDEVAKSLSTQASAQSVSALA